MKSFEAPKKEFVQITGKKKGPTSVIFAGVHGNEKCGVKAFRRLLPNLRIQRGVVLFGYGNLQAIRANKRSVQANLNRMFKGDDLLSSREKGSYEYRRAQFLKSYLNQASALLYIHASTIPKSNPFVICEANAKGIVKYFPVGLVISGFDQVEPGGTDYYMNSIGRIGICVECGDMATAQSTEIAEESILAFLQARGHIEKTAKARKQLHIRVYYLHMTKTNRFVLSKPFADFEEVSKGQIIGIDGKEVIRARKRSVILFAKDKNKAGEEVFLLAERI